MFSDAQHLHGNTVTNVALSNFDVAFFSNKGTQKLQGGYFVVKMNNFIISSLLKNVVELADSPNSNVSAIIKLIKKKKKKRQAAVIKNLNKTKMKRKVPKIDNFYESICKMQDDIFFTHFRMQKSTFKKLRDMLEPMWNTYDTGRLAGRKSVTLEKSLYLTIWKLSNQNAFREVSDRFNIGMGATYRAFIKTVKLLCRLKSQVITFPTTAAAQRKIMDGFQASRCYPFPYVLGCIDGTHIQISQPTKDGISYYNRKGTHSIIVQAVVDSDMRFLDVFIGCPGSCHDAAVWQKSPLRNAILEKKIPITSNCHLIGDPAYPLESFLMVPFKDNGFLTAQQSKFNTILSSTRVFVEQSFGILKKKFRILKFLDIRSVKLAKLIIMSCFVLHNIIIINEGNEVATEDAIVSEDFGENNRPETEYSFPSREEAKNKRDAIATLLSS